MPKQVRHDTCHPELVAGSFHFVTVFLQVIRQNVTVNVIFRTTRQYYVIYCLFYAIERTHPLTPSLKNRGGEPSAS